MTAAEVGWSDPGADPPHEWERTRTRLEEAECALAGVVSENNELRAIVRRVREYAQHLHTYGEAYSETNADYLARIYREVAVSLERTIGDRP